jgi:dephospho-CoA kinase
LPERFAHVEDGEPPTEYQQKTTRYGKPVVGLAGGVGSGKTSVAKILGELGAGVIDSDALSHQEINHREVKSVLVKWWGSGILAADGAVDRQKVAGIVFGDPAQRHRLEALLHPRIAVRRADVVAEFEKQSRIKMIVLDSPLLYEADLDLMCDAVIFVDAGTDKRRERSEKPRHWPQGEVQRREKFQQPLDTKRARADYICDNNSTLSDLRKQVETIFSRIVSDYGAL